MYGLKNMKTSIVENPEHNNSSCTPYDEFEKVVQDGRDALPVNPMKKDMAMDLDFGFGWILAPYVRTLDASYASPAWSDTPSNQHQPFDFPIP